MDETTGSMPLNVLVVDDEINIRKTLAMCLEADGHSVVAVSNAQDALDEAARGRFDLAFVDLRLGQDVGLDLIPRFLTQSPWMRIVIITAHGSIDSAVDAIKRGGEDYLTKPFTPAQVRMVTERLSRLRELEQKVAGLQAVLDSPDLEASFKTASPAMQRVIALARQMADNDTTVLIRGESGTGKGVLAKAIHSWSPPQPAVYDRVMSDPFTAVAGKRTVRARARAFTGAVRESPGRIAMCDGGTLMLDEIGDLPIELQPKLLRFVQDREYERVGEAVTRRADVRMITATNVDLEGAVRAGRFREDLLYRIKVVQLDLPPLRQRAEDIVHLAERFLAGLSRGRPIGGFSDEAWPRCEHTSGRATSVSCAMRSSVR